MNLIIKPMEKSEAMEISEWKYEEPYSIYTMNGSEEEIKELLDGSYYTAKNETNEIVGYFCFGDSARVPAGEQNGIYEKKSIDMGLGMKPELTGQGNGAEFVEEGLKFAIEKFQSNNIRLTVANFNKRAIKVYEKNGFKIYQAFQRKTEKSSMEFITMISMNDNKAYCGINCSVCPVYIATVNNDNNSRKKTAKEWGDLYKREFKEEDIVCYGCKSEMLFFLCEKCDIRECNINKDIDTCSQCNKYPCNRIERFYDWIEKNGF